MLIDTSLPCVPALHGADCRWLHAGCTLAVLAHRVAYNIYLPPSYSTSTHPLPVVYNLHGASSNEHHSFV